MKTRTTSSDIRVDPLSAIMASQWRGWIGYLLAGGFAVLAILALWYALASERSSRWVYVVDGSGSIHAGPLARLQEGNELFRRLGIRAATLAFLRSSTGDGVVFDQIEEIELMFTPNGRAWLERDAGQQKADFVNRRISQKVYIDSGGVTTPKSGFILQTIKGRLERSGAVQGRPFRSIVPFGAVFTFVRNERLDAVGMYPYLVSDVYLELGAEEFAGEAR